ncbi:MAG: hypothetical protein AAGA54_15225 [Myxococcota bacterium]
MGSRVMLGVLGALGLAAGFSVAACRQESGVFTCSSDADCTGNGAGSCQPNGFCAFPDAMCPSGQRYGDLAGGGFANACVPLDEETSGGDTDGEVTGTSGAGTSGPMPATTLTTAADSTSTTTDATTTALTSASGSSSGPAEDESGSTTDGDNPSEGCEILFDDEFAGESLPGHWGTLGTGIVDVVGNSARLTITTVAGDQPTWMEHEQTVPFEEIFLEVRIDALPDLETSQGILSLTRTGGTDAVDLVIDGGTVFARRWDANGFEDAGYTPFDLDASQWLRIREDGGQVLFQMGSNPSSYETFYLMEFDIRDWSGTVFLGADNYEMLPSVDEIRYDRARACIDP